MTTTTFIDGDSIAYAAGYCEHPSEMEMSVDNFVRDITNATQCTRFVGYVENPEGKQNFRKFVAMTRGYKANRHDREPPKWMTEAKHYMRNKWGFQYVTYMESEDACSISAHKNGLDNSIIACIDKDLYQIGGRFYDYKKKDWKVITPEEAEHLLYKQILTGDSTDNIPGIPGCGPVAAEKMLADAPLSLAERCAKAYKEAGLAYTYLLEQARLIYILRKRGDVFTPVTLEQWEAL